MREHQRPVFFGQVLIVSQSRRRTCDQTGQHGLANRVRVAPQVVALKLDQVEGVEEHARVVAPVADAIERRD
jgi:hypothetical protein